MSAAIGPPGQGWHLLSAPMPSPENFLADARATETVPADALALPQDEPVGRQADVLSTSPAKKASQSGKPRRRSDGAANGRSTALRSTSLTALVEGERQAISVFAL